MRKTIQCFVRCNHQDHPGDTTAVFNVVTVFLAWSDSVDPDGDVVIYRVEVDTANTFARPAVHEVRRHCITPADGDSAHDLWVHFDALEAWTYEDPM